MSSDYDRVRTGIEYMTAYVSGDEFLTEYLKERRQEESAGTETLLDGTAALCAALLHTLARTTGRSQHEILQELARGIHRSERRSED
ncbi:hypothetical protein [Streptomyces sp. NPDC046860]|uniref:hypothetical protein n=1 Tax=Streptomyces sp. NPDC046860 TaxID=3154495 RepID=UPI0033DEF1F7